MDYQQFFARDSEEVAKDLLGRALYRKRGMGITGARIIETGAYSGGSITPSRKGMKYSPANLFLMPFRGNYFFNISTGREGEPSCVEIRAIAFHDKIVKGSARIAKTLDLSTSLDGRPIDEFLDIGDLGIDLEIIRKAGKAKNCLGYFSFR